MLGTVFFWLYTATRIVSAVASSRGISSTKILLVCYTGGMAGFVLIALSGTAVVGGSATLLWVGTAIAGVFVGVYGPDSQPLHDTVVFQNNGRLMLGLAGPIFPSAMTLFAEWSTPPSGRVIGVMWAVAFIGDIIGQQVMGALFKECDYSWFGPVIMIELGLAASVLVVIRGCALPRVGKPPGTKDGVRP